MRISFLNILLILCAAAMVGLTAANYALDRERRDVINGCMFSFKAGYVSAERSARTYNGRSQFIMDSLIFHREVFGND